MRDLFDHAAGRWEAWLRGAKENPRQALLGALFVVVVAAVLLSPILPIPARDRARLTDVFLLCIIYSIIALGLNVVVGYTGLLDLGVVAFASIGAYTATILYDRPFMQFPGSFLVVLLIGGLHAVHTAGAALRLIDLSHVLLTDAHTVRFGGLGVIVVIPVRVA